MSRGYKIFPRDKKFRDNWDRTFNGKGVPKRGMLRRMLYHWAMRSIRKQHNKDMQILVAKIRKHREERNLVKPTSREIKGITE